jgi:hypothetical protein
LSTSSSVVMTPFSAIKWNTPARDLPGRPFAAHRRAPG